MELATEILALLAALAGLLQAALAATTKNELGNLG
jgi:hypothetical protein